MHKDAKIFPLTMVADIYMENVFQWTLNFMQTKKKKKSNGNGMFDQFEKERITYISFWFIKLNISDNKVYLKRLYI